MKELKKGVLFTQEDSEVLRIIEMLRQQGIAFPEIDTTKSHCIPFVYYEKGFNLYVIYYFSRKGDSGYMATHYKNFLTENKFNVKNLELTFDAKQLLASIMMQTNDIAKRLNYPLFISTAISPDFMGLIATGEHPINEVTNANGHKN